jgi:hypothetical protein
MATSDSIEKETTFTPGPWKAEKVYGWGGVFCITAGSAYPLFIAVKPKNYYTDYVKSDDGASILSDERAAADGRHVATLELRAELDDIEQANARLTAAAPGLYEALAEIELQWLPYSDADLDRFARMHPDDGGVVQPHWAEKILAARRALRKARGEDRSHEGK